ncbi:MAG TPA: hypothetical protein VHZ74_23690 [Bryobacteraceae bacterium]|jgi:hypothetical protein|nr:hypothetical protein [Bryobacteraceae bacterium]
MAAEFDSNILSGLLKTGLEISLGAASKSIEMVANPTEGISQVVSGVASMLTVPAETGPGLPDKAQALAGVWLKQGLSLIAELQAAGEKLTKGTGGPANSGD